MSLASIHFLLFVLILVALYYLFPAKQRWMMLFVGNCYFILQCNGLASSIIMLLELAMTYVAACMIEKRRSYQRQIKWIWLICVFILVTVWVLLKEINLGLSQLAPLGISYYTLMLISYLCDVYWGIVEAEKNPLKFTVFAGYFPLLYSGPIVRYGKEGKLFCADTKFCFPEIKKGILRILWGLFKKLVIAERLAVIVNTVYEGYEQYYGLYICIAAALFTLQLYADFSGCMDIVLGISVIFGIKLPENFNLPFMAGSLSEFWRRWHITLGEWLKDYVLYPILKSSCWQAYGKRLTRRFGKKLGKKIPVWLGLLISWFLIGAWHGGGWNYIFGVGIFMGVSIVLGEIFQPLFQKLIAYLHIKTDCFSWKLFQIIRTVVLFVFGNSFFRADSLKQGLALWRNAFLLWNPWILFDGSMQKLGLDEKNMNVLLVALLILAAGGLARLYLKGSVIEWIEKQNLLFRWMVYLGAFFAIMTYGCYGSGYNAQDFIYAGF